MPADGQYLDDSYKLDTGKLIEPIRKASVVRQIADVQTVIDPSDLQVEIETSVDDFHITMSPDVSEGKISREFLSRQTYNVSTLIGELAIGWDDLQRVNKSKKGIDGRIASLGWKIADIEDGTALAVSSTGLPDGGALPFVENGTATAFDLTSYATFKTSVATYISTLASTFGNLKKYPLKFVYNDKFLQTALGLGNTTTDRGAFEYLDEQLKIFGGAGSVSLHAPRLGCAVTYTGEEITLTNEADEACAMFAKSSMNYEIYASRYDVRALETNKVNGFYRKIVERWFPFVHRATSILYDIDATP